ncbi:hypothetical protein [Xylella fastidiosa]|uniref:Uncharacterized protein n=2 Tax=Xylella fastidiosa TaxID=2371 RepID=A0AAJ5R485_XYLFS|nr:hypothetical protein [Xylella fastidiosa]WCF28939.1 hypothetical protein OK117_03435 [Xylella fastidiosa subsp. fastidiosa]
MHTPLLIESDGNTWNFEITQELTKELACCLFGKPVMAPLIEVVYRIRDLPSDTGSKALTVIKEVFFASNNSISEKHYESPLLCGGTAQMSHILATDSSLQNYTIDRVVPDPKHREQPLPNR